MNPNDTPQKITQPDVAGKPAEDVPKVDWQKKATLIFLASVGVTLLVTGATGRRMAKKPPSVTPSTEIPSPRSVAPAPLPPAPVPFSSTGPLSFVKRIPGASGMPPRKTSSKLRDLFVNTPGTLSSSVDFMSNHHSKLAKELPKPNFLGGLQDVDEAHIPEPSPEDRGNAVLDAVKAFALATAINMTIAGVGIWSLKSYLGATDIQSFVRELRVQIMEPWAKSVKESDFLPEFMKVKEKPRSPEAIQAEKEEEEELSQMLQVAWRDFLKETGQVDQEDNASSENPEKVVVVKGA